MISTDFLLCRIIFYTILRIIIGGWDMYNFFLNLLYLNRKIAKNHILTFPKGLKLLNCLFSGNDFIGGDE